MTGKIHGKGGVFVPPNTDFSYVLSITLPQPTIRIKIPRVLVKAMQKRNQTLSGNDENGGKNKKKYWATSKKSFRKKVGSLFSNVFGKKLVPETGCKGENDEVQCNGDDEEMNKLKKMIERVDMECEKITRKGSENDGVVEQMALATARLGTSEKEMLEAGDEEGKESERPKSRRTYSKPLSKMNDLELNKGKNNNVDDSIVGNIDSSVACVGEKGANTFGTKGIASLKKAGNFNDLASFRSKTPSSHRKLKTAWWMKKMTSVVMGGKSEKHELCKKRILMGGRCRPLNDSGIIQYDEKGVLLPEIIP